MSINDAISTELEHDLGVPRNKQRQDGVLAGRERVPRQGRAQLAQVVLELGADGVVDAHVPQPPGFETLSARHVLDHDP